MTVSRILATKGRDVLTIGPDRSLAEAAGVLAERHVGALVVTDSAGSVVGIVSERDIVRAVAARGAAALEEKVAGSMTAKVTTAPEHATVLSVMGQMTAGRFRHVPVVEGGRLVGLVSIGDVVKHRLAEMEDEQQALREYIATA